MAVAGVLVILVSVWLMEVCGVACALPPVIDPTGLIVGVLQVYVVLGNTVPFCPSTGVTLNAVPLHSVAVILVIEEAGKSGTRRIDFGELQ